MRHWEYRVLTDADESYFCEECQMEHRVPLEDTLNHEHNFGWEPVSVGMGGVSDDGNPNYLVILRRPIRPPHLCKHRDDETTRESTTKKGCEDGPQRETDE